MSDESMEMCEWFESLIEDMIKECQSEHLVDYVDKVWCEGAIAALEELLRRLNA